MVDTTTRLALPLLAAGQAQKELTHNAALAALDTLVQPIVQSCGDNTPPSSPSPGQSWIVGVSPGGAWAGRADAIATWRAGGWEFLIPQEGHSFWIADESLWAFYSGAWTIGEMTAATLKIGGNPVVGSRQPAIASPTGGATVDSEARTALTAILVALRTHGLIDL